ncbi:MAG: hypothetical protein A3J65_02790 [Candidatus Buchananbacteria bacterium RIFCSPHIGHO2_02_FULL_45_11b]|uniref:Uncharacterized protein n=1 Tax=Candidatus Buchananbacteria bacterium RIFCSPHIGHO2_02_FULL_45_11b TaxID=1797541 RepID=A0A1G1YBU8_9BACT|nr:MAG: hypothetical protein A3J65_02790 [Candidatus Buchananbacteria bacterium RIFCSPHIGHO2_02_FULL_45_11b]
MVLPFLVFWLVYFYLVFGWVKDGQIKLCLNEKTVGVTGSLEDGEVKWSEINRIEAGWQLFLGFRCAFLVIEAKECEIVFCLSVLSPSDQEALKKAFAARGFSWDN